MILLSAVFSTAARGAPTPPPTSASLLFSSRFETGPLAVADAFKASSGGGAKAKVSLADEGTIDAYMGTPTRALKLTVDTRNVADAGATASVTTAPLAVANRETELGCLTLGVDLWVSQLRPVRMVVSSIAADGRVSGSLATSLVPPVAGAYYRFTPDLGSFTAASGKFDPTAPKFAVAFEVDDRDGAFAGPEFTLKADNLSFAAPAYYVSGAGSDQADGRTPTTALASLQRAVDRAVPGDVILMMDGTSVSPDRDRLATVNKLGEPDRWIVIRAAPGQKPVLRGTGWDVLALGTKAAYIELRGLTFQGYARDIKDADAQADGDRTEKDGKPYYGDPRMNTNGIGLDCRKGDEVDGRAHHVRIIGNTVRDQTGAGIALIAADHLTIEGNVARDNCHTMRFASSGISILTAWNFDADKGHKLFIVNNRSFRNRCYVKWAQIKRLSDGNGIIIDQFIDFNYDTKKASEYPYAGRTLVQNNLVYGNGGSGIHAFASNHVDIVNNTAYHNAQSPELNWRQIFAGSKCKDVRIVNNILWAQRGKPIRTTVGDSTDVTFEHNLIFGDGDNGTTEGGGLGTSNGGNQATVIGAVAGEPRFARPSIDDADDADFHLLPDSPAIGAGRAGAPGVPIIDLDGLSRHDRAEIDLGAFRATTKPTR